MPEYNYSTNADTLQFAEPLDGVPLDDVYKNSIRQCIKERSVNAIEMNKKFISEKERKKKEQENANKGVSNNASISNLLTITGFDITDSDDYVYKFAEEDYKKGSLYTFILNNDPTINSRIFTSPTMIQSAIHAKIAVTQTKIKKVFIGNELTTILNHDDVKSSLAHYLKNISCKIVNKNIQITYPFTEGEIDSLQNTKKIEGRDDQEIIKNLIQIFTHYNILQTSILDKSIDQYIDTFIKVQELFASYLPLVLKSINTDDKNYNDILSKDIFYNSINKSFQSGKYGTYPTESISKKCIEGDGNDAAPGKFGLCYNGFENYYKKSTNYKVSEETISKLMIQKTLIRNSSQKIYNKYGYKNGNYKKLQDGTGYMRGCYDNVSRAIDDKITKIKKESIEASEDLMKKIRDLTPAVNNFVIPPINLLNKGLCDVTNEIRMNRVSGDAVQSGFEVPFNASITLRMIIGLQYNNTLASLFTLYGHEFGHMMGASPGSPGLQIGTKANSLLNKYFDKDTLKCLYKNATGGSGSDLNHVYIEHQADLIAILVLEKYIESLTTQEEKIKELKHSMMWAYGENSIGGDHPPGTSRINLLLINKNLHDIIKQDISYNTLPEARSLLKCDQPPGNNGREAGVQRLVNLGLPRNQAEGLMNVTGNNVNQAIRMVSGGRRKFKKTKKNKNKKSKKTTRRRRM